MSRGDPQVQAAVDRLLQRQGRLVPVELLLQLGLLPYKGYEAWRTGELPFLEDALAGDPAHALEQLEGAAAWAQRLRLAPIDAAYRGWGPRAEQPLASSRSPRMEALLATAYARAASGPQPDLFLDGGTTPVLNDLASALVARAPARAKAHLHRLLEREPEHPLRDPAQALIDALLRLRAAEAPDPEAQLEHLEARLEPRARELLGHQARDFLVPFWRRLARSLAGRPFDPARERLHGSWAHARCLDWEGVRASVREVPDFHRHPVLLSRLAEATLRLGGRVEALGHWCSLCWEHPAHAEDLLRAGGLPDPGLRRAWERLLDADADPPAGADWLPAWLLVTEPGLARALEPEHCPDTPAPCQAYRLLRSLLAAAPDLSHGARVDLRRRLKEADPALFTAYMARAEALRG